MIITEYNIWKELDEMRKQLTQLNTKGIFVTSLPSLGRALSSTERNTDLCKSKLKTL
jgi:hypothetical protein